MLPAGFGKGTLKLSDKYKLITRQLLYASLWSQFGWMKSNSLRLFYSSLYYFHSKLITIYGSLCTTHGSFYKIWLHKNSKTWLIDHVKFDITHSKKLLPRISFFTLSSIFHHQIVWLELWLKISQTTKISPIFHSSITFYNFTGFPDIIVLY